MIFRIFLQILAICAVSFPVAAQDRPQPEIASGISAGSVASGKDFMIVTANPHATRAGYKILEKGGSAVDAAIAAQLVLGVVEPQSSGLGGGAFALHYDGKKKILRSYDGRETAPNLAGPYLFYEQGRPMAFKDAVVGGRAVGVPGVPALLSDMHERHGKLTWMELFDDAIKLSGEGFEVSPRLHKQIAASKNGLKRDKSANSYFLSKGDAVQVGHMLKNPAYQETLKEFAFSNAMPFYHGDIAANIIKAVQGIEDNPGLLTAHDFESYQVKERDPVCGPYRAYIVCSMGEPSSGALTLLQILGMIEHFDISESTAQSWHIISQASALAFADRNQYMADPGFVNTPSLALINPEYLKNRAKLIDAATPLEKIEAGSPPTWKGPLFGNDKTMTRPGTSHISVIDSYGDIVSMTTTVEGAFGSHVMVGGFMLNNQLTDFSFEPFDFSHCHSRDPAQQDRNGGGLKKDSSKATDIMDPASNEARQRDDGAGCIGTKIANSVAPGKRPRSSMSPTIVFDQAGKPVLIVGSAGGSRIIGYVLQQIISVLDWNMSIDEALTAPHILARSAKIEMEDAAHQKALESNGNKVEIKPLNSGLTAIHIKENTYYGFADPRREGNAKGR